MKKTSLLMLLSMGLGYSYGQSITPSVVNSTGGSFTDGNAQLSFSIGESSIFTKSTVDGIVTEGVFQPKVSLITVISNNNSTSIEIYPNPTTDILFIKGESCSTYQLINMKGSTLKSGTFAKSLNITELSQGVYILKLLKEKEVIEILNFVKQ
jgi:hypothetical protein